MSRKALARLVVPFVLKAAVDTESRTFEGLAATWDEDLGNDIIHKGAFKNTLAEWKKGTDAMPLLNSHNHFDIFSAIGQMTEGKETKEGLLTKWEVMDGPEGDGIMSRLRPSKATGRPIIGKMSIGFIPTKFEFEQPEGTDSFWDRKRHINEATLKEVSLVLFPMNPNAAIDASSVKMWLKSMEGADPREMSNLDRMMFRKLASRIGILLKAQPNPTGKKQDPDPTDEEDLEDEIDEQDDPPETPDTPPTDGDVDDDSSDDSDEDSSDKKGDKDKKEQKGSVYEMSDALAHRLARLKLSSRTDDIKDQQ